jgi:hypothetical protein
MLPLNKLQVELSAQIVSSTLKKKCLVGMRTTVMLLDTDTFSAFQFSSSGLKALSGREYFQDGK